MKTLSKVLKKKVVISGFSVTITALILAMILTITIGFTYEKVGWISLIPMFFAFFVIYIPILALGYNSITQKYRCSVKTIVTLSLILIFGIFINALPLIVTFENEGDNYIPFAIADENKTITETTQEEQFAENIVDGLHGEIDENSINSSKYEELYFNESTILENEKIVNNLKVVFPTEDRSIPKEPVLENTKPIVDIVYEGSPLLYVGENKEIFINVFDKENIDNIILLKKDIIVSDDNVLEAEYVEDEDQNLSIIITGKSDGYATIQLPEGFAIDSRNEVSDASNILEFEVINENNETQNNLNDNYVDEQNPEVLDEEVELSYNLANDVDEEIVVNDYSCLGEEVEIIDEVETNLTQINEIEGSEIVQVDSVVLEEKTTQDIKIV